MIVPKSDQYTLDGVQFFSFVLQLPAKGNTDPNGRVRTIVYRDIYRDLDKNNKSTLDDIAKSVKIPKYSKMKKNELLDVLKTKVIFQ